MPGRRGTSAGWSPIRRSCGGGIITAVAGRRWEPGGFLVFDWADVGGGLHLFCAVLAWSRWRFVAFSTNERSSSTLGFLAEALHEIGGVPGKLLTDRMVCLKGVVVANVVVPTPDYVRLAAHYGFTPDFVTPRTRNPKESWKTWSATPNETWWCRC